ncbi:MAG: hypothetical protein AAF489_04630 [Bacteroidota bacterium]
MKKILICFLLLSVISCKQDDEDCNDRLTCIAPEVNLQFQSKKTGEDLFANGTYLPEEVTAVDLESGNVYQNLFYFTDSDGNFIFTIGDGVGNFNRSLNVIIRDEIDFNLDYRLMALGISGCCPGFRYDNLNITNVEFVPGTDSNSNSFIIRL